jgi:hypothetical protein
VLRFLNLATNQSVDNHQHVTLYYTVSQDCMVYLAVLKDSSALPQRITPSYFTSKIKAFLVS